MSNLKKKLKIVSISAEIHPFSKTGGLADVARSLPKAIRRLGHEVISITPLYGRTINKEKYDLKIVYENVKIYLNSKDSIMVNYWRGFSMHGLPVYFIECKKYFSQRKAYYGSNHENARFLIFNVASLKLISLLKFKADIINCHDWHTGLIPYYLKNDFRYSKTLNKSVTVFTIHNLVFQFGKNWWEVPIEKKDFGRKVIPHLDNPDIEYINFIKRAILNADVINTVSEKYRDEIMTKKFGQDLHRILKNREDKLFGIVNGISYDDFNPNNDSEIFCNFSSKEIEKKQINKNFIQKKFGLAQDLKTPLICTTSRITYQKGFYLINKILPQLMKLDLQLIILGDGDKNYLKEIKKIARKYPKKLKWLSFDKNANDETLIMAASDFFLLPSHHEPCGINQLKAMRYGSVPIVRRVGGLEDTVSNYNPRTKKGTGFTFPLFDEFSLFAEIIRALETFKYQDDWKKIVERCMNESNSWEIPAKKYIKLYRKAIKLKNDNK